MSVTAPASPRTDAKAGFCSFCRRGSHALCASPRCTCPTGEHRQRPSAEPERLPPTPATVARITHAPAASKPTRSPRTEPVWELVKEEPPGPPPRPKKLTPAERVQPFLEAIVEARDPEWHRVALFGHITGARGARTKLAREFGAPWQWKATNDHNGRPALFVRSPDLGGGRP